MPAADAPELHSLVEQRLHELEQRYTPGRRAMVECLAGARRPVTIGEIAAERPEMARSSAYRHLVDLQTAGVVRRVSGNDEFSRFELAEDLTEHHHHLVCERCGSVVDFTPPASLERSVTRTMGELAAAQGFELHHHQLDLFGLCAACK